MVSIPMSRKKFKKLKPLKLTGLEKRTVKNLMGLVRVILRQRKRAA